MANEKTEEPGAEPLVGRTNVATRNILMAGIAGACLLGAGAGLWARPAEEDQRKAAPAAKYVAKPQGKLEIVLNSADPLAPPPAAATTAAISGPTVSAEMLNPEPAEPAELPSARPPAGLMRVAEAAPAAAPVLKTLPDPAAEAAKLEKARLAKAEKARLLKAKAAKAETLRLQKAKAEAVAKKKRDLEIARLEKAEKARSKSDTRLASAADEAGIEVADTRKPGRLSRLKNVIAKPFKAKPKAEAAETELADAETPKASKKKPEAVKLAKAEPAKKKAAKRCVSSDPGEAIVCADPSLAAADRQLSRAYREAEAAGVPAWQLKQQQQRWLAARAAAAREAPWAVHDVYLARIAELNDMTRDARREY